MVPDTAYGALVLRLDQVHIDLFILSCLSQNITLKFCLQYSNIVFAFNLMISSYGFINVSVMGLFMFSSIIDLIIALEADGFIPEVMTFYLKDGEPYLWTPYGTMINYWDGTVHYAICLWILYAISKGFVMILFSRFCKIGFIICVLSIHCTLYVCKHSS